MRKYRTFGVISRAALASFRESIVQEAIFNGRQLLPKSHSVHQVVRLLLALLLPVILHIAENLFADDDGTLQSRIIVVCFSVDVDEIKDDRK